MGPVDMKAWEGGYTGQGSRRGSRLWCGDSTAEQRPRGVMPARQWRGPLLFSRIVGCRRDQYRRVPSIQAEKSPCRIRIDKRDPQGSAKRERLGDARRTHGCTWYKCLGQVHTAVEQGWVEARPGDWSMQLNGPPV